MRKFRKILGFGMIVAVLVLSIPVLADTYSGYIPISITEYGGTDRDDGVPVLVDLSVQGLVDLGYLGYLDSGRDTRMREVDYGRPYTLESSRVGLVVYSLAGYQSAAFRLYTGYSPANDFDLVVGFNGYVTVPYSADLELGDAFEIDLRGFIDTSMDTGKNLIIKDEAFKIYISAEGSITASIYNTNWTTTFVTAVNVGSGIHRVVVAGDGADISISIDGATEGDWYKSDTLVSVPEIENPYLLMQNSSLISLEYLKVSP